MNKDNLPPRTTPYYAKYQRDIFLQGAEKGEFPVFSTDPNEMEKKAEETLSKGGWLYASSNAGQSWTHRANREAFYQWRIIPRMLVDTQRRDMSCTLKLGTSTFKFDAPIGFAPIGINKIYHPLGELNSSSIAGELNLPYALSTAGSQPIASVAAAHEEGKKRGSQADQAEQGQGGKAEEKGEKRGARWFQLYWPHDEALTLSLLRTAVREGYEACILTLDTWQLGWRHGDVAAANYAFYKGIGHDLGIADPVFRKRSEEKGITDLKSKEAGQFWIDNVWHGKSWSWDDLPWLIEQWKRESGGKPFVLKGIQSVEDAKRASDTPGVDGIVVSNHAGRQVDGALPSLDALDMITRSGVVDTEKVTVMFDSGVRGAADVVKALALGAKLVFVGRPYVYGMSINGEQGVRHVMTSLLADLDILMNVGGFRNLAEMTRDSWGLGFAFPSILVYLQTHDPWQKSNLASLSAVGTVLLAVQFMLPIVVITVFRRYPEWVRTMLWCSVALNCGSMLAASWAKNVAHLIILVGVLGGISGAVLYAPVLLWLNEWWHARRGLASGIVFAGTGIGGLVFPFLLSALLNHGGFALMARVWAGVTFFVYVPAVWFLRPRIPPRKPKGGERGPWLPVDWSFLRDPVVLVMTATTALSSLATFPVTLFLPTYTLALSTSRNSDLVVSIYNLSGSLGSTATGWLSDVSLPLTVLIMGVMGAVLALTAWGFAANLGAVFAFGVLFSFFAQVCSAWGAAARDSSSGTNPHTSTLIFCTFGTVRGIASIVGPFISTTLYDPNRDMVAGGAHASHPSWGRYGFSRVIIFVGCMSFCSALGSVGLWWARKEKRRREEVKRVSEAAR